jgi:hypothetical protein
VEALLFLWYVIRTQHAQRPFTITFPIFKDIVNSLEQLPASVVQEVFVRDFNEIALKAKRMIAERQPQSVCREGRFVSVNPAANKRRKTRKVGKQNQL